ncbi:hypothetical protein V8E53_015300 [Lactarius tabidus]
MSRNQVETNKPSRFTPLHRRAPTPGIPTPGSELVSASGLALRCTGESAYDHPALRTATDDDAEWSTLPKRRPPPSVQLKNSIASSAKFFLPTRTRTPPPMESREVEAGKRPRITLYRPPPRTAAIDLAGLESRYACVRSAMRKRRRASAAAWGALGLPSCGVVHVDGSGTKEIGILVWGPADEC